jgi:prevent-host-death family protein
MATPVRIDEDLYGLSELRNRLPEVVQKARTTKRPMIITKHNKALAAIVDIEELQRLYDLEEAIEAHAVVRELEAAEARDEVRWYSGEDIRAFQQDLVAEAEGRMGRRSTATTVPVSTTGPE